MFLGFLETGLGIEPVVAAGLLSPLWHPQVCLLLPLSLHFITHLKQTSELQVHHHGTFWINQGLKAQKYEFFLLKHQALKQMHPICTHPL